MELKLSHGHFYGQTLKSRTVAGFALIETTYTPGLKLSRHSHERPCFCLVLQGNFTEAYGRRTRDCKPSTLIFRPPDEAHLNNFGNAGGRCFNIEIEPPWMERVSEYLAPLETSVDFHGGPLASLAFKLYREFRRMDGVSSLVIEGLVLEMLAEVSRASMQTSERRAPYWLEQSRELLQAHYAEGVTLAAIAEAVNIHPVHLARVFRHHYRCSVGEYVRRLRIEFACGELSTTAAPLAQIALEAGFSHQSHFTATFKRLTGMTPATYRASFRRR